jgi:hypothetical protein
MIICLQAEHSLTEIYGKGERLMLAYFLPPVLLLFQTDPFLAQRDRMVRDHI